MGEQPRVVIIYYIKWLVSNNKIKGYEKRERERMNHTIGEKRVKKKRLVRKSKCHI